MSGIKTYKIFTAGKMGGLTYSEQMKWRNRIESIIRARTDKSLIFIHPPNYYQYDDGVSETEKKVWEMSQIKDSDIVIMDLATIKDSIGTHIEIGLIEGMNQFGYKHIHIVGIGEPNTDHPWISQSILHREDTLEDAADYIINYLLV